MTRADVRNRQAAEPGEVGHPALFAVISGVSTEVSLWAALTAAAAVTGSAGGGSGTNRPTEH